MTLFDGVIYIKYLVCAMLGENVDNDYIWQNCCDCQEAGQYEYCNHHELMSALEIMAAQIQELIDK